MQVTTSLHEQWSRHGNADTPSGASSMGCGSKVAQLGECTRARLSVSPMIYGMPWGGILAEAALCGRTNDNCRALWVCCVRRLQTMPPLGIHRHVECRSSWTSRLLCWRWHGVARGHAQGKVLKPAAQQLRALLLRLSDASAKGNRCNLRTLFGRGCGVHRWTCRQ